MMSKVFFRFLILMKLVLLEIGKVFIFDFMQVRRLRVQQRIKCRELVQKSGEEENEMPDMPSTIPFLPPMVIFPPPSSNTCLKWSACLCFLIFYLEQTTKTLKQLYLTSFSLISGIILLGGLLAPTVSRYHISCLWVIYISLFKHIYGTMRLSKH